MTDQPAYEKTDADGRFIDHEWMNGDPVWVVYRNREDGCWLATAHPQSVYHFAYKDKVAVAGEEPHLYGYRLVDRDQMFHTRDDAEAECARRNAR